MAGGGFFFLRDSLSPLLRAQHVEEDVRETMLQYAVEIRQYAQENAPWTDQTGDARAGLDVDVTESSDEVTLELFHTVDYGLWLEVKNSGEYAIIMPTLEHFAPEIMAALGAREEGEE